MIKVGDKVTYLNTNLREYVGTVTEMGSQGLGANCKVQWLQPRYIVTKECLFNIVRTALTK